MWAVGVHVKIDKKWAKMDTLHSFSNGVTPALVFYISSCDLYGD